MLNIEKSFITFDVITDDEVQEVTFVGNEIHNAKLKSLNFISHLPKHTAIKFDDNSFSQQCYCDMGKWLRDLFDNSEMNVDFALDTSFCKVSKTLSHCFKLNEGLINMKNFTELVCGNETEIYCEPYHGETKTLDTTATMLFDEMEESINSNMYIGIALGTLLILAVCGTVVILLIRGGIWLKRNGYCMHFRNIRLTQGEPSHDDERVMVDLERNGPKNDDNELTPELLMRLREALNDPDDDIKEQARERIEKLYERYITSDSYTNNNRQDEETHLYEELGNLQNGHGHHNEIPESPTDRIKYMETRFCQAKMANQRPTLVGEYSEPTDATVHLYSELKEHRNDEESEKKSSVKSNESGKMALRPLPEKPKDRNVAGPSTKY